MIDYQEIIAHINDADKRLREALSSISFAKSDIESEDLTGAVSRIERANGLTLSAFESTDLALKGVISCAGNGDPHCDPMSGIDASDLTECNTKVSANYISEHIFRCTIETPSLSKQKYFNSVFKRAFVLQLSEVVNNVVGTSPYGQHKFSRCIVIFVSHVKETTPKVTTYYDNDNLGIKAILDGVLPQFVSDDNILFCDNIYITQMDTLTYSEVFIVEDGYIGDWFSNYNQYDFVKKIEK